MALPWLRLAQHFESTYQAGTGKVMGKPGPWLARSSLPEDWDQDMALKVWLELNIESQKITVIGKHLGRSWSPKSCADTGWLKQVTQDHIQSWLEHLQGWRLPRLSGTVLVSNQFPNKTGFPLCLNGFSCTLFCACWLLPFTTEYDATSLLPFCTIPANQVFIHVDNIPP